MPSTPEEWTEIADNFNNYWNFPNCIGAVDGKHVVMVAPAHCGSTFYNYKGSNSIVLMAAVDSQYKFLYVDVGCNGRQSDGGIFNRCSFGIAMDNDELNLPSPKPLPGRSKATPFVLTADDAFAMRKNIMKPYPGRGLSLLQRVFNYRLSRARRVVENAFGILSARFRIFRRPIHLNPDKTKRLTLACCALHNFLLSKTPSTYAPPMLVDRYTSNGVLIPGGWRNETELSHGEPTEDIRTIEWPLF